jgi:cytochrome c-type biogenesis protein
MSGLTVTVLFGLAFSAGTATFFAPCAFPLLPGYVSYFLGNTVAADGGSGVATESMGTADGRFVRHVQQPLLRALVVSLLVGLGMFTVYVSIAAIAVALGAGTLADIAVLELVVGGVFVVAGGAMAAGWKVDRQLVQLPKRRRSAIGFFGFGALYATAAAGCTAPLFISIMLRSVTFSPLVAIGSGAIYALGMTVVMAIITGASALGATTLSTVLAKHTGRIYRVAGVLLVLSGLAEIYYYLYGFPPIVTEVLPT